MVWPDLVAVIKLVVTLCQQSGASTGRDVDKVVLLFNQLK